MAMAPALPSSHDPLDDRHDRILAGDDRCDDLALDAQRLDDDILAAALRGRPD
jgi:hypothetical protein